jgi:hypothetical protein
MLISYTYHKINKQTEMWIEEERERIVFRTKC